MIIIGRVIGVGRDKGDVEKDEEGSMPELDIIMNPAAGVLSET